MPENAGTMDAATSRSDVPPLSFGGQKQERGIGDGFCGAKDGRVNPHRRPQFVDRLHFLFFLLSVPSLVTILTLFITLYVRSNVDAYTSLCVVSGVASFTALGMTCLLVLCHLKTYTCPTQQRRICRIILLVPVYAMDSFIALMVQRISTIVVLVRDTYEAYVIYQFYFLLIEYLGGEQNVLYLWSRHGTGEGCADLHEDEGGGEGEGEGGKNNAPHSAAGCIALEHEKGGDEKEKGDDEKEEGGIPERQVNSASAGGNSRVGTAATPAPASKKDHCVTEEWEAPLLPEMKRQPQLRGAMGESIHFMPHIFPSNLCFSPIPLNENTLYIWKLLLTQYVILNPLLTLITVPLYFTGYYNDGTFSSQNAYPYLAMLRTVSVSLALSGLVYFYFATKAHMRVYSPTAKFLVIKAVVFLSFWQGVLLSLLVFYHVIPSTSLGSAKELAVALQNFLITLEMYVVSIAHRWVFSDDIYLILSNGRRQKLQMWMIRHVLSISDVIDETRSVVRMAPKTAERMIRQRLSHWRWSLVSSRESKIDGIEDATSTEPGSGAVA